MKHQKPWDKPMLDAMRAMGKQTCSSMQGIITRAGIESTCSSIGVPFAFAKEPVKPGECVHILLVSTPLIKAEKIIRAQEQIEHWRPAGVAFVIVHREVTEQQLAALQSLARIVLAATRRNRPMTKETNKAKKPPKRMQEDRMRAQGYMTVADVTEFCGVTRQTVNLWLEKGAIKSIRIAERIYVTRASLEEYLGPEGVKALAGSAG